MLAIEIKNLFKTFRGKRFNRIEALKGINLQIPVGEVFGFLGPNGAGKSTTIKIIMGMIRPSSGVVHLAGRDSCDYKSRLSVGYLPENPAFYDYLTAEEYLSFVAKFFRLDRTTLALKKKRVLERLDLWSARKRPIRGFSKGMVQRLGIAQTLLHDPDIYIFDEPMSGLDPVGRVLVKEIILELREQKKTVFFSTHITADVEVLCDSIGILVNGVLRESCRIDELIRDDSLFYCVKYRHHVTEDIQTIEITQDGLFDLLEQNRDAGHTLISVVSQQQSLEDFFLKTVNRLEH